MNTFGQLFKISIFGESHGKGVGITIDNCPAGLGLTVDDFVIDTTRRKGGLQKGTTPRQEDDLPIFLSGIFNNKTTGAPLTMFFENNNTRSADYEKQREIPRPGHADFVANKKYGGHEDFRGGGHFSGRLTVCLVAAGVVAKKILATQQITVTSTIIEIGGSTNIDEGLQKAIDAKDSVGGIVDCTITNVPIGIGEPFFYSIEAAIAQLAFSIPAIKGIEFGTGFAAAKMYGSVHNDAIADATGKTKTNNAGGIVGGISNGNDIYFKIAVKPTSSTPLVQNSLNWQTGETEDFSIKGRHDLCIALRVPVVAEAIAAIAITDFMLLEQKTKRVL
jgi:chorismate synthase